jgi:hypothetical protein
MTTAEWDILVGVVVSACLALGPWMFMVHAKLAVLANQVAELCRKMDQAAANQEKFASVHARHATKLETHDVQIAQLSQRLCDLLD